MKNYIKQQITELEKQFQIESEIRFGRPNYWVLSGKIEAYRDILKKLDVMEQTDSIKTYKVQIIESERGFGQKVDEELFFNTEEKAIYFCKEYNKNNKQISTPDWYMKAVYIG